VGRKDLGKGPRREKGYVAHQKKYVGSYKRERGLKTPEGREGTRRGEGGAVFILKIRATRIRGDVGRKLTSLPK